MTSFTNAPDRIQGEYTWSKVLGSAPLSICRWTHVKGPAVGFQSEPDKSDKPDMFEIRSSSSLSSSELSELSELSEFVSRPPLGNISEDRSKSIFSSKMGKPLPLELRK